MGLQDFRGHMEKMARMAMLEKEGILGPGVTIRMQSWVRKGFPDCQDLQGNLDLWGLQDWDFQVRREKEADQESRGIQA